MKFNEGQLIIRINPPENEGKTVEKGGIVKVLSSSSHYEYDLLVEVVKSKNLSRGIRGVVDSSNYKAFHPTLLKRKSKWLTY